MKSSSKTNASSRGFALVVTLSLMILLTVIAVGLLSLSSISLRMSSQGEAMSTARANAKLALMLAIGDLQKHTGPDTRITARADILAENHPPVLGAWKSWEGTNHDATGRPVSPGNYQTAKQERFLKWLVSTNGTDVPNVAPGNGKVTLVGARSVGSGPDQEKLQIHLSPSEITTTGQRGACAWWVGGENTKARVPKPTEPDSGTSGQWASVMKSLRSTDTKPFGLESLLADALPAEKALTLGQVDLIEKASPPVSEKFFHDLSATSRGLLTNAATGGWKKDLSLFTENSALNSGPIGTRDLPLFRIKAEGDDQESLTTLASRGDLRGRNSVFYPWSEYRGSAGDQPIYQHAAVASWNNLIDYTQLYRKLLAGGTGIAPNSYGWSDSATAFNFLHEVRILPVIARIQWVYSHFSTTPKPPPAGTPPPPAGSLQPCLVLTPVITLWNPYNLRITSQDLRFDVPRPLPTALKYSVGATANSKFQAITNDSINYPSPSISGQNFLRYRIRSGFSLQPGETRVFSPTTRQEGNDLDLQPGYLPGMGHLYRLLDDAGKPIYAPGSSTIRVEAAFDTTYLDGNPGVGIYLDMRRGQAGTPHLVYRMVYTPEVANQIYPIGEELATSEPLNTIRTTPTSFMTTVFGARMASRTHLAAKGLLQSSPLVNYTAMGGKDLAERTIQREYRGSNHPVNSPFDYSFKKVGNPDSNLPDVDNTTKRGFIVTGFQKSEGLSRCVIAELPTRPLQSLAELQHWDLRYENPIPPYAFNLIGNSNATPLVAADSVIGQYSDGVNLQHDDSYCANHVLFDDWFFSSIAPDPSDLGTSGRNLKTVFTDFIDGNRKLPNTAYTPITLDAGGDASKIFAAHVNTADSWKTIASRIEVEGMFNVNSTSLAAWRALLGHARNQKIPYLSASGSSFRVALSPESDYAVSRFSISGEAEASASGSSGAFPVANEFTGYRILDDLMIDALAREIVSQVRKRGPFLSLSEFVNRQLSSGELALSGAIQAALDEMAKTGNTNPYKEITSFISRPASATPGGISAGYAFPDAAVGEATFGLPGWTRQADILRPLAPVLTVRDDTFTIRAYGDARDGTGRVIARAVCEAVVQRTRDYVDPADAADLESYPESPANRAFGRRFVVVSFRWLDPAEI
jgi:hypothetical protein